MTIKLTGKAKIDFDHLRNEQRRGRMEQITIAITELKAIYLMAKVELDRLCDVLGGAGYTPSEELAVEIEDLDEVNTQLETVSDGQLQIEVAYERLARIGDLAVSNFVHHVSEDDGDVKYNQIKQFFATIGRMSPTFQTIITMIEEGSKNEHHFEIKGD